MPVVTSLTLSPFLALRKNKTKKRTGIFVHTCLMRQNFEVLYSCWAEFFSLIEGE